MSGFTITPPPEFSVTPPSAAKRQPDIPSSADQAMDALFPNRTSKLLVKSQQPQPDQPATFPFVKPAGTYKPQDAKPEFTITPPSPTLLSEAGDKLKQFGHFLQPGINALTGNFPAAAAQVSLDTGGQGIKPSSLITAPLRELTGEGQEGESVALGIPDEQGNVYAASQQPLLTRAGMALDAVMGGSPADARRNFARGNTGAGIADLLTMPGVLASPGRVSEVPKSLNALASVLPEVPESLTPAALRSAAEDVSRSVSNATATGLKAAAKPASTIAAATGFISALASGRIETALGIAAFGKPGLSKLMNGIANAIEVGDMPMRPNIVPGPEADALAARFAQQPETPAPVPDNTNAVSSGNVSPTPKPAPGPVPTSTVQGSPFFNAPQPEPLPPQNVRTPGQVAPEVIGRPPEQIAAPSRGNEVLAGNQGVIVRPPLLLGEGTPEAAPQPTTPPGYALKEDPLKATAQIFKKIGVAAPSASVKPLTEVPSGNLEPNPQQTFPRIVDGQSAAMYQLTKNFGPDRIGINGLRAIAVQRGLPVEAADTHQVLINKIVDSMTPAETDKFEQAAAERQQPDYGASRDLHNRNYLLAAHGSLGPDADLADVGAKAKELKTQDEDIESVLRQSIEAANAKKQAAAAGVGGNQTTTHEVQLRSQVESNPAQNKNEAAMNQQQYRKQFGPIVYHGASEAFDEHPRPGSYWADSKDAAQVYASQGENQSGQIHGGYIRKDANIADLGDEWGNDLVEKFLNKQGKDQSNYQHFTELVESNDFRKFLLKKGYDGLKFEEESSNAGDDESIPHTSYVDLSGNTIAPSFKKWQAANSKPVQFGGTESRPPISKPSSPMPYQSAAKAPEAMTPEDFKAQDEDTEDLLRQSIANAQANKAAYGSQNKLVTQSDYEAAKSSFNDKATRSNAGLDPTAIADLAKIGAYHFEAGARSFADWSAKMVDEAGERVRPYLNQVWNQINTSISKVTPELKQHIEDEDYFLRLHDVKSRGPISQEDAVSTPWGTSGDFAREQTRDGYSSFSNPERFFQYHEGEPDSHTVAVYSGRILGVGEDGEPLSFPDMKTVKYVRLGDLRKAFGEKQTPSSSQSAEDFLSQLEREHGAAPEIEEENRESGQGGHAGNNVTSIEELTRPGVNYVISKGGKLSYHGKLFAPESTPSGSTHVTVLPDGSFRVNAGDTLSPMQESVLRRALRDR